MKLSEASPSGTARGRNKARRLALQALYQWQLTGDDPRDIANEFHVTNPSSGVDQEYFDELLLQTCARHGELEQGFNPHLDRPGTQLDPIERAILLVGSYELSCRLDIPYRVVINESVELAKSFGAADSYRYVNAVLDQLAAQWRETEYQARKTR